MDHDQFVCEVRCPVHGFIGMTQLERDIVNHPAFQRLRRIKQLAWSDYVYPGASHTRFEHCLGVMHLASKLYEAVVTTSRNTLKEIFGYTDAGLARDWQIVRLAALLHDVGHAPFSHAAEERLPFKAPETYSLFQGMAQPPERYKHEDYSVAIIDILLKDLIEQHPSNVRNYRITANEVSSLISKRTPGGINLFWKDIISGQLDADRMDYLLRDSLHAGVSYGRFDLNRIVSSVCAVRRPQEESFEPKIAIMKGGTHAAEALIVARYWMHKQVYFHKTRLVCDYHLAKALGEVLASSAGGDPGSSCFPRPDSPEELNRFLEWDDYRVMGLLATGKGGEHGQRLMTRDHYRRIWELEVSDGTLADLEVSTKKNDAIVNALGPLVKFDCITKGLWYKTNPASELVLVENDGKEIGILSDHSALIKSINIGYLRFIYADRSDIPSAREKLMNILGQQSRSEGIPIHATDSVKTEEFVPKARGNDLVEKGMSLKLEPPRPTAMPVKREPSAKKGVQDVI